MRYLLDTNIISRRDTYQKARTWINGHQDQIVLSIFTVAEIRQGIHLLPKGEKRAGLEKNLEEMLVEYTVLPFALAEASAWGAYVAEQITQGRTVPLMDSFIAATAIANHLWVVTENSGDFPDVDTINPLTVP